MKRHCLHCRAIIATGSYCASCEPAKPRNGSTRAWRTARQQALDRDRGRCVICGAPATEVDHLVRVADGGADDPANLRAICAHCHTERHRSRP